MRTVTALTGTALTDTALTDTALTAGGLVAGFAQLGVRPGMVVHVEASLRALGPVDGGAATVADALLHVLGPGGTLVAYTATPENSATSRIHQTATAGLTPAETAAYRARMPRFDPANTPARRPWAPSPRRSAPAPAPCAAATPRPPGRPSAGTPARSPPTTPSPPTSAPSPRSGASTTSTPGC